MAQCPNLLEALDTGSLEDCIEVLDVFNKENEKAREISWLTNSEKESLWLFIFKRLQDPSNNLTIISPMLNTLRILSREKITLENVMTQEFVECLLKRSGLESEDGPTGGEHLNGMKVIFNMLFQSEKLQSMFIANGLLDCLVQHVNASRSQIPLENQYFLLKTFFIITALSKGSGAKVRNDLNGIEVLVNYISVMGDIESPYEIVIVDVISEALKVLYNIVHNIFPNQTELKAELFDSKDFSMLCQVCKLVRRNLVHQVVSPEKKVELDVHSIHMLCAVPPECYDELLNRANAFGHTEIIFEGNDLAAIDAIVNLLEVKLQGSDRGPAEPILVALCKMSTKNRIIRRYLKKRILPPLTKWDVTQRPETGSTIRNKLCSVIHTPSGYATEAAANLVFVLCKENVKKMVKYTGYGNAAGLLANRGLMLGGKGDGQYSEESENSDTDEYFQIKDRINDIEGWMKPEEEPPIEMTEQQKEFEAMKLVETIGKMAKTKAIQPCRIGPDGKPQPIEHVLELQEALDSSIKSVSRVTASDSDSD